MNRKSTSVSNKAYRIHLTHAALSSLAGSLIWTAMMVYQVQVVGLTPLQLVLVGTVMEITVFLFEIPTGIVADVYSRRLSILIGTVIIGVSYVVQGLFPVFEVILIGQVLWGLGYTFTSGAYEAWMVDELGQQRTGEAFIRAGQIGRVLSLGGIGLSVLLGSINLAIPIVLGGGIILLTALYLLLTMPETGFSPTPREDRSNWQQMAHTFREGIRVIRGRPTLIGILAIGVFYGLYSEAWDRLWQIHLIETIGLPGVFGLQPVAWFGLFNVLTMILGIVLSEIVRRRLNMNRAASLKRALFGLTAVMIAGLVAYGLAGSFAAAVAAFFAFVAARELVGPIYATWSNQQIDSNVRATVLSMQSQTDAIGQIAGGPPLGAIGQRSLRGAFIASALLLTPVLGLLTRIERTPRAAAAHEEAALVDGVEVVVE
jgi:MFS transporter, DHA3 family, tetracycline resistance protein